MSDDANGVITSYIEAMSLDTEDTLRSINMKLGQIVKSDGLMISQTSLKQLAREEQQAERIQQARNRQRQTYQQRRQPENNRAQQNDNRRNQYDIGDDSIFNGRRKKINLDTIVDDFEKEFKRELFGTAVPLDKILKHSMSQFAQSIGSNLNDLGADLGKQLGQAAKNTQFGNRLSREVDWFRERAVNIVNSGLNSASKALGGTGGIDISGVFEEDRSQESPNVDDIDTIVSSNASEMYDNLHADLTSFGQEIASGFDEIYQGLQEVVNTILHTNRTTTSSELQDELGSNLGDIVSPSNTPSPEDIIESSQLPSVADDIIDLAESVPGSGVFDTVTELGEAALSASGELSGIAAGAAEAGTAVAEMGTALPAVVEGATAVGPALAGAGAAAAGAAVAFPVLTVALVAGALIVDKFTEAFGPAIEGFKSFSGAMSAAGNRVQTQQSRNLKLQQERTRKDAETIVKAAYNVVIESTQKIEEVWDNVLSTVTAAQGYEKAGVQDLWQSYAERLKKSNMASVISSADIMSNLESVLKAGLSGQVAEEFAYMATILNNALPTQDFFQYASTYASLAANAVKNGASQQEALEYANAELEAFASNLIYASREVAGGFSTGLTDGASLFQKAAQIALTSRTGDVSEISGILTSVSGIVGSIAPDLANSIVDAVYSAATGGNSSELTALRSMAGVGASNTAFLKALASDPKSVFSTLFTNLSQLQQMSAENYMEVAEALSSVFGMSQDAFARVDFAYLADAINAMDTNNSALAQNMELLVSGQTTSSADQLRMQKINEYMIEEGLAYVLDNEVARSIQEHMWEEQMMREIQETEFAVNLQGSALEFLQGIKTTVANIVNLVNPVAWVKKAGNLAFTALEAAGQHADLENIIKQGVVGTGTEKVFHQLTVSNEDYTTRSASDQYKLTQNYLQLMGGTSVAAFVGEAFNVWKSSWLSNQNTAVSSNALLTNQAGHAISEAMNVVSKAKSVLAGTYSAPKSTSAYTHKLVSKSVSTGYSTGDWRSTATYNPLESEELKKTIDEASAKDKSDKFTKAIKNSLDAFFGKAYDEATSGVNATINRETVAGSNQYSASTLDKEEYKFNYWSQDAIIGALTEWNAQQAKNKTKTPTTFEEWVDAFEKANKGTLVDKSLEATLQEYGQDIESVRALFESRETEKSSQETKARELHEVQFWEDMQHFATIDFPWYMREWQRYYIEHEAYNTATDNAAQKLVENTQLRDDASKGVVVDKLAELLAKTDIWNEKNLQALSDPAVQTNVLLAKLLVVAEAIEHQNNESSIVSVPTALSALGLGLTKA